MPYRMRNASAEYRCMPKIPGGTTNPALAANMKRLRAGRSIGDLRAQMAERGIKIGAGTLHRAVLGQEGNRLESLTKIAEFFETTVDQLLQFEGVDETYWPFSDELQQKVLSLKDEQVFRLENVMRAHLGLIPQSASSLPGGSAEGQQSDYSGRLEVGTGALNNAEIPAPQRNAPRTQDRRPKRRQGGRGA